MHRSIHSYPLRFFHSAVTGQLLCAVSIVFMLQANIGTSPWNVLKQGLSSASGMSFGAIDVFLNVVIILTAVLLGERIGFGSLFCVFLPGPVIDFILRRELIPLQSTLPGGLLFLGIGMELMELSTWIYMREELGEGPRDALMVALSRKTGKSAGFCRVFLDGAVVTLGWLLGGQVGIGTIASMFGIGTCIGLTFRAAGIDPKKLHQEDLAKTLANLHPGKKHSRS